MLNRECSMSLTPVSSSGLIQVPGWSISDSPRQMWRTRDLSRCQKVRFGGDTLVSRQEEEVLAKAQRRKEREGKQKFFFFFAVLCAFASLREPLLLARPTTGG